ncbi:MAG TPA: cytochrome c oxidase subunit 3 [Humisphaera sp.]
MTTAAATNPISVSSAAADAGLRSIDPPELDVSNLPANGFDWHSPLWWGNLLMMFIETSTVGILLATYFYVIRNEQSWPPPRTDRDPPLLDPSPDLLAGTLNTVLLVGSVALTYVLNVWARRRDEARTRRGLVAITLVAAASVVLRLYEFPAMHFKWNETAYGGVVWTILGMHLIYVLSGLGEYLLMCVYVFRHGLDDKHALDVTIAGAFWYWVAGTWVVLYATLYWVPRWI